MHALVLMQPSGCLINTCGLQMPLGRFRCPPTRPKGHRWQEHTFMNVCISNNLHARGKCNEKKAFDWIKKKTEFKWDELQTQVQQLQEVSQPLLVCLTSNFLLGIIGIIAWGVGFIPQSAWMLLEKNDNLVEIIWTSRIVYAKPFKVAWGA
jgi:hypothetical protein